MVAPSFTRAVATLGIVVSNDKAILHITGGITVHRSLGVGEQNCP